VSGECIWLVPPLTTHHSPLTASHLANVLRANALSGLRQRGPRGGWFARQFSARLQGNAMNDAPRIAHRQHNLGCRRHTVAIRPIRSPRRGPPDGREVTPVGCIAGAADGLGAATAHVDAWRTFRAVFQRRRAAPPIACRLIALGLAAARLTQCSLPEARRCPSRQERQSAAGCPKSSEQPLHKHDYPPLAVVKC
jgi:hypothetical protein